MTSFKYKTYQNRKSQVTKAHLFCRRFRALIVHIDQDVPLPFMDVHSIPERKPTSHLLELLQDNKALLIKQEGEKRTQPVLPSFFPNLCPLLIVIQQNKGASFPMSQSSYKTSDDKRSSYVSYESGSSDDSNDASDGGFVGSDGKKYANYNEWYEKDTYEEDWRD